MKEYMFDVHMHTHYSYDSLLTPKDLIKTAAKRGLSTVIVTDHNTTKGGFACVKAVKNMTLDLTVFVGNEIKTEHGDVIGLFLHEEIKSHLYHDVIDEINAQDGIVYLPHPFASYTHIQDMDLSRIQVLEAYNGRHSRVENEKALGFGRQLGIPVLGGSDAHIGYEIGSVKNATETDVTDENALRKVILDGGSSIQISFNNPPLLPRFKMTEYMSWVRSGHSERVLQRVLLFLIRRTRHISGLLV